MSKITVLAIRRMEGEKPLKAFVDIQIGDWAICDFRIIKQNSQRAWVSAPQSSWKDPSGEIRYRTILTIPAETKQRIDVAILSAWERETCNATIPE